MFLNFNLTFWHTTTGNRSLRWIIYYSFNKFDWQKYRSKNYTSAFKNLSIVKVASCLPQNGMHDGVFRNEHEIVEKSVVIFVTDLFISMTKKQHFYRLSPPDFNYSSFEQEIISHTLVIWKQFEVSRCLSKNEHFYFASWL